MSSDIGTPPANVAPGPVAPTTQGGVVSATIGNPRDIQGIMGLSVVGGALVLGGVVIVLNPSAALQVFEAILATAGPIIGFYYGVKSQQ